MARILCTVINDLSYDRRMHRICTSLAEAGHQVTLIGRRLPDSRPLPARTFDQHRLTCAFQRGKAFYLEYNLRLFGYLMRHPFDIVCSVDLDTILPGLWASRLRAARCVYDAHEYFSEVPEVVHRPWVQSAWEAVAAYAIPRVDAAYTVGEALGEALERRYGISFAVIRNLPKRREQAPRHRLQAPLSLLYQGALNRGRGLETVLAALPQLPGIELCLAGEGDLSTRLRQLVVRYGLQERVRFLGYTLPEDLPGLADRATLGLNLLENQGLSYYYSAANKAFDYIQAGLPSLQMDFPEYRRLHDRYDVFYLLSELSPSAVVRAIQRVRENPQRYQTLADNCRASAAALSWEREEPALLQLYQQCLG